MSFSYSLSVFVTVIVFVFVFVFVSVLYFCFNLVRGSDNEFNMKQTRLIAKVLWKVSGDGKEKKPAPMNTMQKGATHTSKTNLTSLSDEKILTLKIVT